MPGQVDELTTNLQSRQTEEITRGLGSDLFQRAAQPQHGALEHVIGLFPTPQSPVGVQHLSSQPGKAATSGFDQIAACGLLTGVQPVEAALHLDGGLSGHGLALPF
jgi:hypothetical protein